MFPLALGPTGIINMIKVVAIVIAFVIAFVGGYKYNQAEELKNQAELRESYDKMMAEERERRDQISKEYEAKLAAARGKTRVVTRTITKEVEKPIYKECKLPETGVKVLQEAAKVHNESRGLETVPPKDTRNLNDVANKKNAERNRIKRPD